MDSISTKGIFEKGVWMIQYIGKINDALEGVNDIGEPTGFFEEANQIGNDALMALGSLVQRMSVLEQRIKRTALAGKEGAR